MTRGLPLTNKEPYKHKLLSEFPEGFIVVIDTRETDPLFYRGGVPRKGIPMVRKTMETGDYSLLGFECCISIERKKPNDLYNCLGKERDRFKRELTRLACYQRKWLLVEASETEALSVQEYSAMHPNAVRQSLVSIDIKMGISIHYAQNKTWSEIWVLDRLVQFYKAVREGSIVADTNKESKDDRTED